jgi:hypothetical protein
LASILKLQLELTFRPIASEGKNGFRGRLPERL